MKLRQVIGLGAWVLLGAAAMAGAVLPRAAEATGTGPQAAIGATTFDFGHIYEDQSLSHTFVLRNTGSETLRIEDVDPDCACTAADYDHSIPPGGQGSLTLTIRPYSVMHQFKKETRVRFNDPDRPLVVFTLKGVGQPFIEINPSHIIRFRGAPGDNLKAQVRFTSHLASPFKITDVRNYIPDKVEVSLKAEEPDKVYVLTVTNKWKEGGTYGGIVELLTNSKQLPRLIVRIFGELYLPSAGNP